MVINFKEQLIVTQLVLKIHQNQKVHCHVHKSSPLVQILSQQNQVEHSQSFTLKSIV